MCKNVKREVDTVADFKMKFTGIVNGGKGAPEMTDEEILQSLIAANVLSAVTSGGSILTDENHNILMM